MDLLASHCAALNQDEMLLIRPSSGLYAGVISLAEWLRILEQQRRLNAGGLLLIPAYHGSIRMITGKLPGCALGETRCAGCCGAAGAHVECN